MVKHDQIPGCTLQAIKRTLPDFKTVRIANALPKKWIYAEGVLKPQGREVFKEAPFPAAYVQDARITVGLGGSKRPELRVRKHSVQCARQDRQIRDVRAIPQCSHEKPGGKHRRPGLRRRFEAVIISGVVSVHTGRRIEQLKTAAGGTLKVMEFILRSEHHLADGVSVIRHLVQA